MSKTSAYTWNVKARHHSFVSFVRFRGRFVNFAYMCRNLKIDGNQNPKAGRRAIYGPLTGPGNKKGSGQSAEYPPHEQDLGVQQIVRVQQTASWNHGPLTN
jgi:hypothetical protein